MSYNSSLPGGTITWDWANEHRTRLVWLICSNFGERVKNETIWLSPRPIIRADFRSPVDRE